MPADPHTCLSSHLATSVSDCEVQRGLIVYLACLEGSGPKLESRNSPENN